MSTNRSFIQFDTDTAEAMLDTLSGDDRLWSLIGQGLTGKMGAQELGYEILCLAEKIDDEIQTAMKEQEGLDGERDEHAENPGAA